jgi:hypothetical protein
MHISALFLKIECKKSKIIQYNNCIFCVHNINRAKNHFWISSYKMSLLKKLFLIRFTFLVLMNYKINDALIQISNIFIYQIIPTTPIFLRCTNYLSNLNWYALVIKIPGQIRGFIQESIKIKSNIWF